ncbi:hypothetical protein RFI_17841 [Reticulomyxa filosa]|uniref:Uncharacterized protein n=1 Tax=Reticulomyxa filosa TaxID=46433 RepID=X6MZF2_RETFI|nr:hypothetical protein RFI_17841 [Reticulomyxa filosa]|eukprot:ETO19390.1 hypothetical protein RFI_17841 [Reticulomyxa filosa]
MSSSGTSPIKNKFNNNIGDGEKEKTSNAACWHCQSCINRNVVNVHFTHRFLESIVELFFIFYYSQTETSIRTSYSLATVLIALVSAIAVPILYLITRYWLIIGDGTGGLEMTIFGFLRQAHIAHNLELLYEFVARVPKSVNEKKKVNGRTPVLECIELKDFEIFTFFARPNISNWLQSSTDVDSRIDLEAQFAFNKVSFENKRVHHCKYF